MGRKAVVGVYLDPEMKRKVAVAAASLGVRVSAIYVLGARLVLALLEAGRVPECLGGVVRDPRLLVELEELARLAKALAEEPSYEVV